MTGYLKPYLKQMTPELRTEYRSFYCGLCHTLKGRCGIVGTACLSYEVVSLLLLSSALEGEPWAVFHSPCSLSPIYQTPCANYLSPVFAAAADVAVLLAGWEAVDNAEDGGRWVWRVAGRLLRPGMEKARRSLAQAQEVEESIQAYYALEKSTQAGFFELLDASGRIVATAYNAIQAGIGLPRQNDVSALAHALGQWIYLTDACDDWQRDWRHGCFNPLRALPGGLSAREVLESIQREIEGGVSALPLRQHREMLHFVLVSNLEKTSGPILTAYERGLEKDGGSI